MEADETYFLESRKGSREWSRVAIGSPRPPTLAKLFPALGLSRPPRQRGGKASKRGLSRQQVPVLIVRDRNGATTDAVLPRVDAGTVGAVLSPILNPRKALLCIDRAPVYRTLAQAAGVTHRPINQRAGQRVRGSVFHIQHVNAYHARLKGWMRRFKGVSTKYLANYLGWRRVLETAPAGLPPEAWLRLPAAVLLREIRARGYSGGETRLKQFVRGLAPVPASPPIIRFETELGHQMQADWAAVGRGTDKLRVFIATLAWSRATYVEFCDDERVETLIRCHERAFLVLGGVPKEVLYDNMETVIIERNAYGRGVHRFHAGFLDYAMHAGFLPRLCHPYRAQTKGKVERFIGYLKGSFWVPFVASTRQAGLRPDKPAANAAVARWLREVANARVHATTGEVPAERLPVETASLQALPAPYGGRSVRRRASPPARKTIMGYQHPLAVYEELMLGGVA